MSAEEIDLEGDVSNLFREAPPKLPAVEREAIALESIAESLKVIAAHLERNGQALDRALYTGAQAEDPKGRFTLTLGMVVSEIVRLMSQRREGPRQRILLPGGR